MKHIYNYLSKQDDLANAITGVDRVIVFVVQINSLLTQNGALLMISYFLCRS